MKTSSTALLATMAAASTPAARAAAAAATLRTSGESDATKQSSKVATTSSGSERRHLSGKSGKSTNALGLATPDDYHWISGNYGIYDATFLTLINGESAAAPFDTDGTGLEINFLPTGGGLALQAKLSFSFGEGGQFFAREIYEGVASYNSDFANQVTFYSDHLEFQLPDGSWAPLSTSDVSDVGTLRCSKLSKVPSGSSIICDAYSNDDINTIQQEVIASVVWTEVTD